MPILNGFEASSKIREYYDRHHVQQPYIVACTGLVHEEYDQKAWAHQIDEMAQKPIPLEQLK